MIVVKIELWPGGDETRARSMGHAEIANDGSGGTGGVAGTGIAFPEENQYFWDLTRRGEWEKAREIYRWFTPLLHLDVSTKFVQYIKLAVQECGLGTEWVRAPRLVLKGEERKRVLKIIHDGIARRPKVPKRKAN